MSDKEITDFIEENFNDNRKVLIDKINEVSKNPNHIQNLQSDFGDLIKVTFKRDSFSSGNPKSAKKKNSLIGDISDIWTFCLNTDFNLNSEDVDWDFTDYLDSSKELHLCTLWVNWFLPVYYLETTYEFIDKKKKICQSGPIKLINEKELKIVETITNILTENKYQRLELDFLNLKILGISTDLSGTKEASIFECLFSDIIIPVKHLRKNIKTKNSKKPQFLITEYLNNNREIIKSVAEVYHNGYSSLSITFDKNNKLIETESKGKLNGKKFKLIKIKYD